MNLKNLFQKVCIAALFFLLIVSCGTKKIIIKETETPPSLIPIPAEMIYDRAAVAYFDLTPTAKIFVEPENEEIKNVAEQLAEKLRTSTGYAVKIAAKGKNEKGNIYLKLINDNSLGDEGYKLSVTKEFVTLEAVKSAGLFYGIQTLMQLLPDEIESKTIKKIPWRIRTVSIKDYPHFKWRGAMLDVARHFFTVKDVKRYIDLLAFYKINKLHLHLSDDQGWRIEIKSWQNLTKVGSSTAVNGDSGGFYTQEDYKEIVKYAEEKFITIIPEIDLPGHTNAALASYPELNCDGIAPKLYTGIEVGFSSLCIEKEITYKFIDDVIKELAAITPGQYIHIGGDEAKSTKRRRL